MLVAIPSLQRSSIKGMRAHPPKLLKLPSELQLFVIENLDALDILHLQLTCKRLHDLIETEASLVWKLCLRRHCLKNRTFWPSFRDLSTASEFKDACTSIMRFLQIQRRAFSAGRSLSPPVTKLLFPEELLPLRKVHDIYLVPGGRFFVTIEASFLSIWDLKSVRDDPRPKLLLRHPFEEEIDWASAIRMIGADKFRILLSQNTSELEEENALHGVQEGLEELKSWIMLEITCTDNGDFSIEVLGRISVVCLITFDPIPHPVIALDKVVLSVLGFTFVWDIQHKKVSTWALPRNLPGVYTVIANQGHICYVTDVGVHGIEVPPFRPLGDNEVLRLLPAHASEIPLPSSFFVPHQHTHRRFHVIPLEMYNTGTESRRSFLYDVAVNGKDKTIRVYRYQFILNTANPMKSTLTLTALSSCPLGDSARSIRRLIPWSCRLCNDRMAIVWAENREPQDDEDEDDSDDETESESSTSTFVSVSAPVDISDAPIPPMVAGTVGELSLVPSDLGPRAVLEFCPTSGRVVVRSLSETREQAMTIHDFI